jgi:ring-1,2-phenylacetyl-CoA epoxidase subunit PaaC
MNISITNPVSKYVIRIADTSLILGQRLGEWCGHGPILEEDIALTNISLDLIGQARAFLTYAGETNDEKYTEDDLAFFRDERQFSNTLLAEQPNGDFGQTIIRQFFISTFQFYFFDQLKKSADKTISALAEKSLKEVTYHMRHSADWTIRLGDGTEESKSRILKAVDALWRYTGDLFSMDELDRDLISKGIALDLEKVREQWTAKVTEIFNEAGIPFPTDNAFITGGIRGTHSEHLGHMLAEMQILPRSMPGVEW